MPITQEFLDKTNSLQFSRAADIDDYFVANFQKGFIDWFNEAIADQDKWSGKTISASKETEDSFARFWAADYIDLVFSTGKISLLQFLALQCIIITETGGSLRPVSEKVNKVDAPAHPGIAYAFDEITGLKHSYNTLAGNKTCLELFSDADYVASFNGKALADQLKNTTDAVWEGEAYPVDSYSVSTDEAETGFVTEADFYKFRGRGLIQTTSRTEYKKIVDYVLSYGGDNQAVKDANATWAAWGKDADGVATMSANNEWDELFMNSDLLIAAKGIWLHNDGHGDYLGGIDGSSPANAGASIRNVGKKVNGGNPYADLFLARVIQIIEALS